MIKVYEPQEKLFNHNGLKILHPLKAEIFIEDNGEYFIDIESSIEDLEYLQEGMIIRTSTRWGEQGFRLTNPQKRNNKIIVRGYHLWKDSSKYVIVNSYAENKNCNDALDHFNNSCDIETPFKTISDIVDLKSIRIVRKTLEETISLLIDKWGGHLYRDNWNIGIKSKIGKDRGIVIKYGKNSTNIEATENWDNVVTKILPVGYDGITLPELYLTSQTNLYNIPYTKIVKFEQDINQEDFKDENGILNEENFKEALYTDLRYKAEKYLMENQTLKCNYKVKAIIEDVIDLGDTILVEHEKLGIRIVTNVISLKYDCIRDKYKEVEFGNYKNKLKNLINTIKEDTNKVVETTKETVKIQLQEELKEASSIIWGALGSGSVIYEGNRILIVDRLPKETATNVIVINSNGIGFSKNGINGIFNSAWTIDGTLDMQQINVINLVADLIKGGTFKLGGVNNTSGTLELYDEAHSLIGIMNKEGLKMYGADNSYVLLNNEVGFAGYDKNDNKIYWVDKDEFHQKKSVIEEEITLCNKMRFIPITIYDENEKITNDGIGLVSTSN